MNKSKLRELMPKERREIKKLVIDLCANYDKQYGCLPLDCDCFMLAKWWTGCYCTWFQNYLLPQRPELKASLLPSIANMKPCRVCGTQFVAKGRKVYCSDKCKHAGGRTVTAARVRRYRAKGGEL